MTNTRTHSLIWTLNLNCHTHLHIVMSSSFDSYDLWNVFIMPSFLTVTFELTCALLIKCASQLKMIFHCLFLCENSKKRPKWHQQQQHQRIPIDISDSEFNSYGGFLLYKSCFSDILQSTLGNDQNFNIYSSLHSITNSQIAFPITRSLIYSLVGSKQYAVNVCAIKKNPLHHLPIKLVDKI